MNTIASLDQFKPIRIGKNLEVNYKTIFARKLCSLYFYFADFGQICVIDVVNGNGFQVKMSSIQFDFSRFCFYLS